MILWIKTFRNPQYIHSNLTAGLSWVFGVYLQPTPKDCFARCCISFHLLLLSLPLKKSSFIITTYI